MAIDQRKHEKKKRKKRGESKDPWGNSERGERGEDWVHKLRILKVSCSYRYGKEQEWKIRDKIKKRVLYKDFP